MPIVGLPFILENMLQSAIDNTNLICNGNGPLAYINLKFNVDSICDKTEQDNSQVKYIVLFHAPSISVFKRLIFFPELL